MDAKSKAQKGLDLLKEAFLEEIRSQEGRGQTKIARALDVHNDVDGGYLQYSVCKRLESEGKIKRGKDLKSPQDPEGHWWIAD